MDTNAMQKILKESSISPVFNVAKAVGVLYLIARTVKTCYEIVDHMEKRKKVKNN